jgi:hypothetical protein
LDVVLFADALLFNAEDQSEEAGDAANGVA